MEGEEKMRKGAISTNGVLIRSLEKLCGAGAGGRCWRAVAEGPSLLLLVVAMRGAGILGEAQRLGHRHARPAIQGAGGAGQAQQLWVRGSCRQAPLGSTTHQGTRAVPAAGAAATPAGPRPPPAGRRQPPTPSPSQPPHRDSTSSCTNVSSLRMVMLGMTTTCAMSPSHASCASGASGGPTRRQP